MMRHSQPQPQPQTTSKFDLCSIAKLPGVARVAKKGGGEGEEGDRGCELTIKIPSKLPGRDQLVPYTLLNRSNVFIII